MAMNKQRRTSNINNIVVYDAAGNVTLPANLIVSAQLRLSNYTSASSYPGTVVGFLAFDSSGNILTTATPIANAVTFNNAGSGDASGITYNGTAARTISYNTVGAAAASHIHDDRYLAYGSNTETSSLAVGWYTIAVNAGDRASAKFILRDTSSGNHQSTVFYATHHFGSYSDITVLSNSRYGGDPFANIRIKTGGTYDGALLQVYIDLAASTVKTWMLENIQTNGWVLKNWVPDNTDPGGVANFAALTVNSAEVNLTQIPNGGISTTGGIYGGGDTTQYLHLHTNNFNSYAPTLTGTGASGTWSINVLGSAGTASRLTSVAPTNISTGRTAGTLEYFDVLDAVGAPAAGWFSVISMRHGNAANEHGFQLANGFGSSTLHFRGYDGTSPLAWSTILHSGNYNSYAPTLTGTGASGTWGISITGNAGTVGGYAVSTAVGVNTVVVRDASGYIFANYINSNVSESENPTINTFFVSNGDGYLRKATVAHVRTALGNYGGWISSESDTLASVTGRGATTSTFVSLSGGGLFSGTNNVKFRNEKGSGVYIGSTDNAQLQAYSEDGGAAFMSFHRVNSYAVNMGLDPDNVFRIGGWSAASNRLQLDMSGNLYTAGNMYPGADLYFAQLSSPYTGTIRFGDNTGWIFRFQTSVSGTWTTRFSFADNGTFTAVGDVVAYSDARVKTNVQTIADPLDKVIRLRGVTYNRIDDTDTSEKMGVIAQEIQEVIPQVVTEGKDGMLGVSYGNLTAVLIEAIKAQQQQIDDLNKQIKFLANNL